MADAQEPKKIRLDLLDGTVEVTGSEDFVRRAQVLLMRLAVPNGNVPLDAQEPLEAEDIPPRRSSSEHDERSEHVPVDIRSLKEQKQPRNVVDMAALVAHYVSNVAPASDRRETITAQDITKLFGNAGYQTTMAPRNILFRAKAAGYLDSAGTGEYKLNPVGYNLVTAGLPAGDGATPRRRKVATKKRAGKKRK